VLQPSASGGRPQRGLIGLLGIGGALVAIAVVWGIGSLLPSNAGSVSSPGASQSVEPSAAAGGPTATVSPPAATPQPSPSAPPPTPVPTPVLVPAPLTGLLVSPDAALQRPIAVMVDDDVHARPQSGFNSASIVWHGPAEGGVPRYMMIFQDRVPAGVGPVRSARQYFVEWASEWKAMYVHHGGSPQAIATLSAKGAGQWVYNADGFRWLGQFLWRTKDRFAPHNVYTDGANLRKLATRLHADDAPISPIWAFGADASRSHRPTGGTITVTYPYETITYRYDAETNRYVRYINKSKDPQIDRDDGQIVAPANVVILRMAFGPLNDGHPDKHRLEARDIGKGEAWISTNGVTIKGTWRKKSATAPTLLFGPDGKAVTLTAGQTFVQVLPLGYSFKFVAGSWTTWQPPRQAVGGEPA
jgi:Protein of unknown function (DUF3048) N-terminal domain/Protein of unknown function (DUF3048) C-terminal domain